MNAPRIFLIIFLCFAPQFLKAQIIHSPNLIHDDVREGLWTVLKDAEFNDVADTALAKYFRVITYKAGKPDGIVRDYYISGALQWEGKLLTEVPETYDSTVKYFYENGQVQNIRNYANGQLNGEDLRYYPNGQLQDSGAYKDDKPEGHATGYFENGNKSYEGTNINGKANGWWKFWNEDGSLNSERFFKDNIAQDYYGFTNEANRLLKEGDLDGAHDYATRAVNFLKQNPGANGAGTYEAEQLFVIIFKKQNNARADEIHRDILLKIAPLLDEQRGTIATRLGDGYYNLDLYDLSLQMYRIAHNARKDVFKNSSSEYLESAGNLGYAFRDVGKYDSAAIFFKETLDNRRSAGLDTAADFTGNLHRLAGVYLSLKQPLDAIPLYTEAAQTRFKNLGETHEDYQASLTKLSDAYFDAQQFDSTRAVYERYVHTFFLKFGGASAEYIGKLIQLGNVYNNTGESSRAKHQLAYALSQAEIAFGKNSPTYATALKNAAPFYSKAGFKNEATGLYCELLAREGSDTTAEYREILQTLGDQYYAWEDYNDAAHYYGEEANLRWWLDGANSPEFIRALTDKAWALSYAGRSREAIDELEPTYFHFKNAEKIDSAVYITVLKALGPLYQDTGNYSVAYKIFREIMDYNRGRDTAEYLSAVTFYAASIVGRKSFAEGVDVLKDAVEIARKKYGEVHEEFALQMYCLASAYYDLKQYDLAEPLFKKSNSVRKAYFKKENDDYAKTLLKLATLYRNTSRYPEMHAAADEALKIYRKLHGAESAKYADQLRAAAATIGESGDFLKAEKLLHEALEIREKVYGKQHEEYAYALDDAAEMAILSGKFKEADNYYAAAKRVRSSFLRTNPVDYITSLLRYVDKSIITRNYTEAEQLCLEAKAVLDSTVGIEHELYPRWLFTTASVYANVGRSKQTGEFLAEAVEASRKYSPQDTAQYCKFITAYGVWQQSQGQYDHAENSFLEAQQLLKAMDDTLTTEYVGLLGNIGAVYSAQQEFEKAEPFFKNALVLAGNILGPNHLQYAVREFHYGYVLFAQGKFEEAHQFLKKSYETFYRLVPAAMRNSYEFPQYLGMSHWTLGAHEESEKEFLKANSVILRVIHENFPAMSEKEKTLFWESVQGWFSKYNFITVSRSHERPLALGDMYTWQLATKAILLNSSKKVKERIFKSGDKKLIELYNDWLLKKEELTKLYSMTGDGLEEKITRAEADVNLLEKKLSEISQTFASEREKKEATWQDVRSALKKGEAAVEIIRIQGMTKHNRYNDTIYYAALIVTPETKKTPQLVLLKNGLELESEFLNSYQNRIRQKLRDADSYGAFWAGIDSVLKNYGTIYLSADGVYNQINLNTLLKPDGKYVAEEKDIRLVTNTKDILSKENKALLKKQKAELFGFPKYNLSADDHTEAVLAYAAERDRSRDAEFSDLEELSRAGISELPGTKTEVENVSEIIAGNQTQVGKFLAEESLEEAVKSVESPYILHIATHGFFLADPDKMKGEKIFGMERSRAVSNPLLRSGLLFAGATNTITGKQMNTMLDDGILTAYEAMNLNLDNTELVVLSACETGLGEVKNGEGVYGLQRAFQVAGAKTLIMSLWKVSDEATQELMTNFYKAWLGGMDKHAAFKSAQFSLKEKYKHPYFWGAFVMVGD